MKKVYTRIIWENFPSERSPLNEANLNRMDLALDSIDNRVVEMDATKVNLEVANNLVKTWSIDEDTGIITVEHLDGSKDIFDLNIEKIPVNFELSEDGILTMTTDDGTQYTANIGAMIPVLTFEDSDTIAVSVSGEGVNKTYSFAIKSGSVTEDMLQHNYLADIKVESAKAQASEAAASQSAASSENSAILSESWAVGGTNTRAGEDENNSKYYADVSAKYAADAQEAIDAIDKKIGLAEFDVDENGYLIYTDNSPYQFSIDDNGNLNWEVA